MEVKSRSEGVKAKDLLKVNVIPAIFYGRGVESKSLQVDYKTFRRLFRTAGNNTILDLSIDGKEGTKVLIHEVKRHPITDTITHVDFINVRMDQEIHTHIPVELLGTAPAVKDLGGVLMHQLHEIEVKCLPKDLIPKIELNIESLVELHSAIRVADLSLPAGITVMNNPEDVVVTVIALKVEVEEPVVAAPVEGEAGADAAAGTPAAEGEKTEEAK